MCTGKENAIAANVICTDKHKIILWIYHVVKMATATWSRSKELIK
jgi:hypothetical protein